MKYLIGFLHLCLQLNSIYMSPYITRNMHPSVSEADKDKLVKITDPKYLYACVSEEVCRLIKEFDISADNRFSCYELAIKIELPTLKRNTNNNTDCIFNNGKINFIQSARGIEKMFKNQKVY